METVSKIFQAFTYWPTYLILKFFVHFEIQGQENLRGLEKGPIIFASNHSSYVDGPISAAIMPRRKGQWYPKDFFPVRFLARRQYFRWYYLVVAFYVWINGSIKIEHNSGRELSVVLQHAVEALKNHNAHIWIYPEGGFDGIERIRPARRGVAYLQKETGAPLVPVAIRGSCGILCLKTLFRMKKVRVKIGSPIYSLGDGPLEDDAQKVMEKISELFYSM